MLGGLFEPLYQEFPSLRHAKWAPTSAATPYYNCIAFAAGDVSQWWWPSNKSYWPHGVAREETISAFEAAFALQGYTRCEGGALEGGVEKVAIYAAGNVPKHAARQLPSGDWTSKIGKNIDITHALADLEGQRYGRVVAYLGRPRPEAT